MPLTTYGSGSPINRIKPVEVGHTYKDRSNLVEYRATGLTRRDWERRETDVGGAGETGETGLTGETGETGLTGVAGAAELGSVERESNFTSTSNAAPGEDIPLLTLTFTVVTNPVYVVFGASDMSHPTAITDCSLALYEGSTLRGLIRGSHTTVDGRVNCGAQTARFATAGEHVVRLTAFHGFSTGAITVYAAAGAPIYLRAVEMQAA